MKTETEEYYQCGIKEPALKDRKKKWCHVILNQEWNIAERYNKREDKEPKYSSIAEEPAKSMKSVTYNFINPEQRTKWQESEKGGRRFNRIMLRLFNYSVLKSGNQLRWEITQLRCWETKNRKQQQFKRKTWTEKRELCEMRLKDILLFEMNLT